MKVSIFGLSLGLSLFSLSSQAASVRFETAPVKGFVQTQDIKLKNAQASLGCHFEDVSGFISTSPRKALRTRLTQLPQPAGSGAVYSIQIDGGSLTSFHRFANLSSCAYRIQFSGVFTKTGQEAHGEVVLAGSNWNMSARELKELLSHRSLGNEISLKLQPLHLDFNAQIDAIITTNQ